MYVKSKQFSDKNDGCQTKRHQTIEIL